MLIAHARRVAGFTLLEMVVTMSIFAILVAVGVPTLRTWIGNVKVRAVADALQNGLRMTQAESLRRSRQIVFSLTNSTTPDQGFTAATNGSYWSINTIPFLTGEVAEFVEAGVLASTSSAVQIAGPAEICFNSLGRLVTNAATGIAGGSCTAPGTPPVVTYMITLSSADRPLNVTVNLGGQVHMCDTHKTLSLTTPDGC